MDAKKYIEAWNEHISDFNRLGSRANTEQREKIKKIQNELKELVLELSKRCF